MRIQEEAEEQELSVASFARVATVARTLLWGVRRGAPWADFERWGEALEIIDEIERRDKTARAKLAKERAEDAGGDEGEAGARAGHTAVSRVPGARPGEA